MSCLLNSLCSYCKHENSGNAVLWLKTPLGLPGTFRIEPNPSPWILSSHRSAPHLPPHPAQVFTPVIPNTSSFTVLTPPRAVPISPLCFVFSWSILLPPFRLADSLSASRSLKHHVSQKLSLNSPGGCKVLLTVLLPKLFYRDEVISLRAWLPGGS